jgi:hypothetical protein
MDAILAAILPTVTVLAGAAAAMACSIVRADHMDAAFASGTA